jgi:hypothetical protein
MKRLAVLGMLVALSGFALAGSALAQEEDGGASDSGAATAPDDAAMEVAACPPGSSSVNGAPCSADAAAEPPDPFSTIVWEGASGDTPTPPRDASDPEPGQVGPIR